MMLSEQPGKPSRLAGLGFCQVHIAKKVHTAKKAHIAKKA